MTLSEKSRSSLYRGLRSVMDDEEAVAEVIAAFPAGPLDEVATRDHVSSEIARLEASMTDRFAALDRQMAGLGARTDQLESRVGRLESRMDRLESRMDRLEERLVGEVHRAMAWTIGTMLTLATLLVLAGVLT